MLVFGIFFLSWCVWTEPGIRFVNRISVAMGAGPKPIELDFNTLNGEMSEADLMALYPGLDWFCSDQSTAGDSEKWSSCEAKVLLVNGIKAYRLVSYGQDDKLQIVYVEYEPDVFMQLVFKLDDKYSRSGNTAYFMSRNVAIEAGGVINASLLNGDVRDFWAWKTKEGLVISSDQRRNFRNNVVAFWASNNHMNQFSDLTRDGKPTYGQVISARALPDP